MSSQKAIAPSITAGDIVRIHKLSRTGPSMDPLVVIPSLYVVVRRTDRSIWTRPIGRDGSPTRWTLLRALCRGEHAADVRRWGTAYDSSYALTLATEEERQIKCQHEDEAIAHIHEATGKPIPDAWRPAVLRYWGLVGSAAHIRGEIERATAELEKVQQAMEAGPVGAKP